MMAEAVAGGDNESDSDTDNDAEEPVKGAYLRVNFIGLVWFLIWIYIPSE